MTHEWNFISEEEKNADNAENAVFNPLPDDKTLDWSKLKQTADNILKCI